MKTTQPHIFLFYKALVVPGGAERLLIEEYKAFKEAGKSVKIVVFNYKIDALFDESIEDDIICLRSKFWLISLFQFVLLLRQHSLSIVITSSGIIEAMLACIISRKKYYLHLHHPLTMNLDTSKYSFFLRHKYQYILKSSYESKKIELRRNKIGFAEYWYISFRQLLMGLAISLAENIFVLSEFARNELKYIYGVESKVVQGAIITPIPACSAVPFIDNFNGLKILSISRLEPQKRVDKAIYAFYEFLKVRPNSTLFIGGSGSQEVRLKGVVEKLNIKKNVIFLGFIPDAKLMDFYFSVDIFLSLDWADYNITVYEAVSANTKAVVSEEGEFDDGLFDGGYIYNVNPLDTESITSGMVLASKSNKIKKGFNLSSTLEMYTWSSYCNTIAKICNLESDL